jgi:two-component system cell cycle sensor histidine kinase/response regulator CckA
MNPSSRDCSRRKDGRTSAVGCVLSTSRHSPKGCEQPARTCSFCIRYRGPISLNSLKLLLVEDDPVDAHLIELAMQGFEREVAIQRVDTAEDLERVLVADSWDVVIADDSLPGFSGFDALRIVRKHDPDVPFILVSETAGEEPAVEAMRRGAHDYLVKSNLTRLVPALRRELHEARVRRERAVTADDLRRSEERFRALIENGSDIISMMSREGRNIYVSPSAQRLLGYTPDEICAMNPSESIHPDDRSRILSIFLQEVAKPGSTATNEYRTQHKDGSWRWIESIGRNLLDHPSVAAVVISSRDITERRLLQEQLAQSELLSGLGRLAGKVAHEFNNVLMGIQPFGEIIRRAAPDVPRIVTAAESILNSVTRGRRITEDIFRFTQPAPPSLGPLDGKEWIETVTRDLNRMLGARHAVALTLPEGELPLFADAQQLQQVVTNVVINARDAMPDGGTVRLRASRLHGARVFPFGVIADDNDYVHVQIADDGGGMSSQLTAHIFEPLFTTKKNGTGLGLAVAEQIIRKHNGHIFVESQPGQGTTFHIFVPSLARAFPAAPPSRRASTSRMAAGRILLVEDDANVAEGLADLLQALDYRVTTACDGTTAIATATETPFDVVVLDVNLPDMSGLKVFEVLRSHNPALPVVFSTGHCDASTLSSLVGSGPNVAFLLKPYEVAELIRRIHQVVVGAVLHPEAR